MVKHTLNHIREQGNAFILWLSRVRHPQKPTIAKPREANYAWMHKHRWQTLHKKYCDMTNKRLDILFIGDSITEGWADTPVWQKYFSAYSAEAFGIGGDATQNLLWRIQAGELNNASADLVIILIGTNNFGLFNHGVEATAQGVEQVVDSVRAKSPTSKILLLGIFPRGQKPDTRIRQKITHCNQRLSSLAQQPQIFFLDISQVFLEADGSISEQVMHDYIHLTDEGYQRYAKAIIPKIENIRQ